MIRWRWWGDDARWFIYLQLWSANGGAAAAEWAARWCVTCAAHCTVGNRGDNSKAYQCCYSATVRWFVPDFKCIYLGWLMFLICLDALQIDACSWNQDVSRLHISYVSHWFLKCTGHGAGCRVEYFYDQLGTAAPRISNSFSTRKKLSQNIKCTLCSVFIDIIFQSMLWCTI